METEPIVEDEEQEIRYKAPWPPAIVALLYANSHYLFVPYWIILLFFYLIKDKLIYDGVAALDWVFFVLWVPLEVVNVYFARRMLKLMENENFWPWVLSSIVCIFFEVYAITLTATTLYLEYIIIIFVIICQCLLFIFGLVGAFYQSRPMRIQPE